MQRHAALTTGESHRFDPEMRPRSPRCRLVQQRFVALRVGLERQDGHPAGGRPDEVVRAAPGADIDEGQRLFGQERGDGRFLEQWMPGQRIERRIG
jgi:hypothetical protein